MTESTTNTIIISDFSVEIVSSMLRCIYDPSTVQTETSTNDSKELFNIANKYDITHLKHAVQNYIIVTMTKENVIEVLKFGDMNVSFNFICVYLYILTHLLILFKVVVIQNQIVTQTTFNHNNKQVKITFFVVFCWFFGEKCPLKIYGGYLLLLGHPSFMLFVVIYY